MEHFDVAVGVILKDDHTVLIAERPPGKFMPGVWEFPGGKLEPSESPQHALKRELEEELGIQITQSTHFMTLEETYHEHNRHVRLHVYTVREFVGQPRGAEGQAIKWCQISDLKQYTFPSANTPIIEKLVSSHHSR